MDASHNGHVILCVDDEVMHEAALLYPGAEVRVLSPQL
jgi:hypothetical protein